MEDGRSLGRLGLSLDSAEIGETGTSILWHSVVGPGGELEVEHLPRFVTQLCQQVVFIYDVHTYCD